MTWDPPRCRCGCTGDLTALLDVIVLLTRKLEAADRLIFELHRERVGR